MQLLKTLLPFLASSTLVTSAVIQQRAQTAAQLVANIDTLTQISQKLQPVISNIQTGGTVVAKRQGNPFQQDGTTPYNAADSTKVSAAFTNFVAIHQETLKIIIGKSGLIEGIFLGPVAAALRSHENVLDTYAFGIVDAVPSQQAFVTGKKSSLDETLGKAVCAYTPAGTLGLDLFC